MKIIVNNPRVIDFSSEVLGNYFKLRAEGIEDRFEVFLDEFYPNGVTKEEFELLMTKDYNKVLEFCR